MSPQLHHIITLACDKSCSYCINDLKDLGDTHNRKHASLDAIEARYASLSERYSSVKISGGEPTRYKKFEQISRLARKYFADVELLSANADVLTSSFEWVDGVYDRICFSLHEPYIEEFYDVSMDGKFVLRNGRKIVVYLSCLTDLFERLVGDYEPSPEALLRQMMTHGFDGLTIRQEWPNGRSLSHLLPAYVNFSIRYNSKRHCESQLLLMPDLSTKDNRVVAVPVPATRVAL